MSDSRFLQLQNMTQVKFFKRREKFISFSLTGVIYECFAGAYQSLRAGGERRRLLSPASFPEPAGPQARKDTL